ncbi:predicted protein [Naegleria gruberi]|uniref:Predicted protein n=1 Tax=Naegleria gruberi TaxID=5762 RepID=D2VJ28_NAEGR|nr:uncharacterized protein NAEGRDRAFT_49950 [Naegleria gruberi]EFC43203.1 predicted protein [Naegleria gruberi]|eukprot:XP_002675947.1 predicted protein [Naegleria gruberi strain NEG-M]
MAGKKSSKKKDPNAPKRPKTGFFLFCDERREKVKATLGEGEKKSASEVSKLLGEEWGKLTDSEKDKYNSVSKKNMEVYKKQFEEYKKNKPESSDESESSDDEGAKKKKKKRKAKKDENAPKRPLSSYMLFSQTYRKSLVAENPTLKVTEVAKLVGEKWGKMNDAEKAPYVNKAAELKAAYNIEKSKYDATQPPPPKKKTKKEESEDDSDEDSESE